MTDDCNKNVEAGFGAATLLDRVIARLDEAEKTGAAAVAFQRGYIIKIARHYQKQLAMCDEMLTKAGVPEWTEKVGESVPGNSVPCRLEWYLNRRKNVASYEIDQKLQSDLAV